MAQVQITDLPQALPLTGAETVPIVQDGVTVRTTTGAISGAGALNYPFLTVGSTAGLTQARYLSVGTGLSLSDNGAGSTLEVNLTGAALSLDSSGTGIQVKTGPNTLTGRQIQVGAGLGITDGDGIAGDPTIALGAFLQNLVSLTGTGILALQSGSPAKISILGVTNQISITNGDGSGNVTVGMANNPVVPGNGSITVPNGTTGQRVTNIGAFRYNTTLEQFEGYTNTGWNQFSLTGGVTTFSAGSTGLTPNTPTNGAVVLGGTLNVASGGTGANTLTGYVYGNGTSAMTASTTIPTTDLSGTITNAQLANSAITINGSAVSLGGSITVTATASNALTIGTGLTGGSYNGSTPVTIAIDSTVATLTGSQTLTNKSMSGSSNTFTNIPNSALTNSSLTIGSTNVALGGTVTTLAGLTSITLTQDPVSDLQVATKGYVDSIASGLNYHQPVNYASTAALPAYTYNNGASGVGATITANANGALSFGGGSPTAGQRLLVKDEAGGNAPYNGIYTVTQAGSAGTPFILTRATDYDTSGSGTNEIDAGDYVLVLSGTNASTAWVQQTPLPITVGTTALVFLQFNAPITYSAGTGLNLSPATTFNISDTGVTAATYGSASSVPTIAVNAQGQITSATNTAISIPAGQVTGLGTMATQNANNVAITGGAIDGTTIGGTTPAAGTFTTLTATGQTSLGGAAGSEGLRVLSVASTVNWVQARGHITNNAPSLRAAGSDTNIGLGLSSQGTGAVSFYTNSISQEQFRVAHTASAVNYVQVTGAATTGAPVISAQGSDTNVGLTFNTKGTGAFLVQTGGTTRLQATSAGAVNMGFVNNTAALQVTGATSQVNSVLVTGSATGIAPVVSVGGTDTNISQVFQSKGTGAIDLAAGSSGVNISNGGTVTAITRTAAGTGYTSPPAVAITAPTTAGGVQATATVNLEQTSSTSIIAGGGTGYTVNDVITVVGGTQTTPSSYTVTSVSGGVITGLSLTQYGSYSAIPSNPVSVTGGTGTGATLNITWQIKASFTITNAGSGYVEQPTVSFSGGGGSGATAFATVGSTVTLKSLNDITVQLPSGPAMSIVDSGNPGTGAYLQFTNSSTSNAIQRAIGANTNIGIYWLTKGTSGHSFNTNNATATQQMVVSHTASAVNYVQVTGAATTVAPQITAQGSDTNIAMVLSSKGTSDIQLRTNNTGQVQFQVLHTASAVNRPTATGSIAGAAPVIGVAGSDTNIDLTLTPKGTGKVVLTNGLQGGAF